MKTSRLDLLGVIASIILRMMTAFAVLGATEPSGYAQVIRDWVARYDGLVSGIDRAWDMALDRGGNIYVTGDSQGDSTGTDFITIKYSPTGSLIWVARYNGPANLEDLAKAITVDSSGNIFVTGPSCGIGADYDYATIKYDSAGAELWAARYNGPGNGTDEATSIAIDGTGNACVTGWSWGGASHYDFATIKYDTEGNELWLARYNGTGNGPDTTSGIAADAAGNVYVTGVSWGGATYLDYATVKYDSAGTEQWVARFNYSYSPSGVWDTPEDIGVDANENVYVTGTCFGYANWDYVTLKYNYEGVQQWETGFNDDDDHAQAQALDTCGNVYVTGYSIWMNDYDIVTLKYDSAGAQQWWNWYHPGSNDYARAIAVDASGNAYVAGESSGDYVTLKCNGNGNPQWAETYHGTDNGEDVAVAVSVDDDGNVFVTGRSWGGRTNFDYATIRYCPTICLNITPINPPIQIPTSGGAFHYTITLTNNAPSLTSCDIWCMMILPDSNLYGPVLGPVRVRLHGGETISRERTQTVPGRAPAGQYSYNGYVGTYPSGIWSQDSFDFTKLGAGRWGLGAGDWTNTGESFDQATAAQAMPDGFTLEKPHPNPFNPTTVLSFELRTASLVKLNIYDLSGRRVAELINGWREAGSHEVTFDGSGLASGVYLVRLDAAAQQASQKIVLMK